MRKTISVGLILSAMLAASVQRAAAGAMPQQKCAAAKQKAAGKDIAGELGCYSKAAGKAIAVDPACLSKVTGKTAAAFTKADSKGACVGDDADVAAQIDGCIGQVLGTATGTGKCPAAKIKATGGKAAAKLTCTSKSAGSGKPLDPACLAKAESKFSAAVTKADAKGACAGTAGGLEAVVDNVCVNPIASALPPVAPGCGNGIVESNLGETCDDGNTVNGDTCPSNCIVQSCTPVASTRTFTVSFAGPANVAAVQVLLDYPEGKVVIPGSGNDANVLASISNTPPGALLTSNDLDYALIQSVTSLSALTPGPIFRVTFQDCSGSTPPTPADFTCTVTDAADTSFNSVSGVTCSVSAP